MLGSRFPPSLRVLTPAINGCRAAHILHCSESVGFLGHPPTVPTAQLIISSRSPALVDTGAPAEHSKTTPSRLLRDRSLGLLWLNRLLTFTYAYLTLAINECRVMGWFPSFPIPFLRLGEKNDGSSTKTVDRMPMGGTYRLPPPQRNADTDL